MPNFKLVLFRLLGKGERRQSLSSTKLIAVFQLSIRINFKRWCPCKEFILQPSFIH